MRLSALLLLFLPLNVHSFLVTIDFAGEADVWLHGEPAPAPFTGWLVYDTAKTMVPYPDAPHGLYEDALKFFRVDIGGETLLPVYAPDGYIFVNDGPIDSVVLNWAVARRSGTDDVGEWNFAFWGPGGDIIEDFSLGNLSKVSQLPRSYISFDSYEQRYAFEGHFTSFEPREPVDSPVPEPAGAFLLGTGILALTARKFSRKRR